MSLIILACESQGVHCVRLALSTSSKVLCVDVFVVVFRLLFFFPCFFFFSFFFFFCAIYKCSFIHVILSCTEFFAGLGASGEIDA